MDYPEGATPLDPDDMEGLKFRHVTTRAELDHLEQVNIESGLAWLDRKKNIEVLSENFARELHKKLFGDVWKWAGTFRKTEKSIGIDPRQVAVQFRQLLGDTQFWVDNETFDPLEIAARFHHRTVYIHLFPNGNGRHARIMADTILTNIYDLSPIDWEAGYDLQSMNKRRKQYIAALRAADDGDFEQLLEFVNTD
jgi:Fic-DOC domain mobile mystery protein B